MLPNSDFPGSPDVATIFQSMLAVGAIRNAMHANDSVRVSEWLIAILPGRALLLQNPETAAESFIHRFNQETQEVLEVCYTDWAILDTTENSAEGKIEIITSIKNIFAGGLALRQYMSTVAYLSNPAVAEAMSKLERLHAHILAALQDMEGAYLLKRFADAAEARRLQKLELQPLDIEWQEFSQWCQIYTHIDFLDGLIKWDPERQTMVHNSEFAAECSEKWMYVLGNMENLTPELESIVLAQREDLKSALAAVRVDSKAGRTQAAQQALRDLGVRYSRQNILFGQVWRKNHDLVASFEKMMYKLCAQGIHMQMRQLVESWITRFDRMLDKIQCTAEDAIELVSQTTEEYKNFVDTFWTSNFLRYPYSQDNPLNDLYAKIVFCGECIAQEIFASQHYASPALDTTSARSPSVQPSYNPPKRGGRRWG